MPIATGAAIASGIMSLLGTAISTAYAYNRNKELDARDDNAIQRRVADLKAAGLNPLLAAGTGAGVTTGFGMNLDTSQAGNFLQNAFDLKNQRELYKQNQLYTKLMEVQLAGSRSDYLHNQEINALTSGMYQGGSPFNLYDKFGNFKNYGYEQNFNPEIYEKFKNTILNNSTLNFNQSKFDLKTQNYQNYLNLVDNTLQPLLDVAGFAVPYKFKKVTK